MVPVAAHVKSFFVIFRTPGTSRPSWATPARTALSALATLPAPVLGVSTSSFRISLLLEERFVHVAVRLLHERLVEAEPVL